MNDQPVQSDPTPRRAARVLRAAAAEKAQPLYPVTRLLKGAVLQAGEFAAQAEHELEQAKLHAAQVRQAAEADADSVRRQAFASGSAEAAAEFSKTIRNFQTELDRLKGQFAVDVQRVAFKIAKLVLDVELQLKPERIVDLVSAVLERARLYNKVVVHLHPDDVERVRPHGAELAEQLTFAREVQFQADDDLPPHGVRVETEMGTYDGSIDVQLKKLQAHLLGASPDDQSGRS